MTLLAVAPIARPITEAKIGSPSLLRREQRRGLLGHDLEDAPRRNRARRLMREAERWQWRVMAEAPSSTCCSAGCPLLVSLAPNASEILGLGKALNALAGRTVVVTFDDQGITRLP